MYLFFAIILFFVGLWFYPGSIGDIPFKELTLNLVFNALLGGGAWIYAGFLCLKSLEHDRIWPWRWTWPYFGNLLLRSVLVTSITLGGMWVIDEKNVDGFWGLVTIFCIIVGVLYALFSSEVEYFSEEKGKAEEGSD